MAREPDKKSPQSGSAPKPPAKLLPMTPATQPATVGKAEPVWRLAWPKLAPQPLPAADPGPAIMAAVDQIAADLRQQLPADRQLGRMFQRYGNLLAEGEGVQATEDLRTIDHYVAEQALGYARLRRKDLRANRITITKAAAFCAVSFVPGKVRAVVNFSLTGRGHEARGTVPIEITLP